MGGMMEGFLVSRLRSQRAVKCELVIFQVCLPE
jgi:hypothetical protein